MLNFLDEIVKVYKRGSVVIDNKTFFLNRVITMGILTFCFIIQVGTTFFKVPIDCMGDSEKLQSFANLYCYVHATYSIDKADLQVTLQSHSNVGTSGNEVRHDYYQWVTLALIAQAALTYLPTLLWKAWEGGRIKSLVTGLQHPGLPDEKRESSKKIIKQFLLRGAGQQRFYLCRFMICDLLNLAVVLGQLYFINFMIGDVFTAFNFDIIKVLGANPMQRTDRMAFVFPTVAKCLLPKFGPSGRQETRDFLCVLPFNLINEKMYIVLWVWFVILAILTALGVFLRLMQICFKQLRVVLLLLNCHPGHEESVNKVVSSFDVADWFVLCQIGKNLNTSLFSEMIDELALEMKKLSRHDHQQILIV